MMSPILSVSCQLVGIEACLTHRGSTGVFSYATGSVATDDVVCFPRDFQLMCIVFVSPCL